MTCRRARSLIPLLAGGDLPARSACRLDRHLEDCPGCRAELRSYIGMLTRIRDDRPALDPGWTEAEWAGAVRAAVSGASAGRPSGRRPLRPAFAYGLAFTIALAGIFTAWNRIVRPGAPAATPASGTTTQVPVRSLRPVPFGLAPRELAVLLASRAASDTLRPPVQPRPPADVPAFTWISGESGLTIIWFLNDNIALED